MPRNMNREEPPCFRATPKGSILDLSMGGDVILMDVVAHQDQPVDQGPQAAAQQGEVQVARLHHAGDGGQAQHQEHGGGGGIQMPRPALPVFMVAATSLDQPDSRIQGMVMEPTVAALALLAPETMPNRALAQADT